MAKRGIGIGPLKSVAAQNGALGLTPCTTSGCDKSVKLMRRNDGWVMRNCSTTDGGCGRRIDDTTVVSLKDAVNALEAHAPVKVAYENTLADCAAAIAEFTAAPEAPEQKPKDSFYTKQAPQENESPAADVAPQETPKEKKPEYEVI